jgi:hypothetical protein
MHWVIGLCYHPARQFRQPRGEIKSRVAKTTRFPHAEVFRHANAENSAGPWRTSGYSQITSTKLNGIYGRPELLEAALKMRPG